MTITYATRGAFLLTRWKGSVMKSVWQELSIWLVLYYAIYLLLKFLHLDASQRKTATEVITAFNTYVKDLPLVFILGFYVGQVATRWWNQVLAVPWPDEIMIQATMNLTKDEQKAARESTARWVVLSLALVLRQVSSRVFKRFPNLESLITAGLMTREEMVLIVRAPCDNVQWQMPLDWILNKIVAPSDAPPNFKVAFISSVNLFKSKLHQVFLYDWVSIPLVYTQTVAIVVYGYFAFALIGHQYYGKSVDLYVPWQSILQFVFFVGWLNVGRDLMHPWGEDDDDIELNWLLDRHAMVAYSLATASHKDGPEVVQDDRLRQEMGNKMMTGLTYSVAAAKGSNHPPKMRSVRRIKEAHQQQVKELPYTEERKANFLDKFSRLKAPYNRF